MKKAFSAYPDAAMARGLSTFVGHEKQTNLARIVALKENPGFMHMHGSLSYS